MNRDKRINMKNNLTNKFNRKYRTFLCNSHILVWCRYNCIWNNVLSFIKPPQTRLIKHLSQSTCYPHLQYESIPMFISAYQFQKRKKQEIMHLALEWNWSKNSIKCTLPVCCYQNKIIPSIVDVPDLQASQNGYFFIGYTMKSDHNKRTSLQQLWVCPSSGEP